MLGAMTGDIVGSIYEFNNIKTKDFPLFQKNCSFTDDSVMTTAIAVGVMNGAKEDDFIDAMKIYGKKYPYAGYGISFKNWLNSDRREPYNSWGNGSAMRVSPVGWVYDTLEETEEVAACSAAVTHNHPEGIKGAEATAAAIFLARKGKTKEEIREYIEDKYEYCLTRTLESIRKELIFNESCMETVPEAITAFLLSTDFEDAIRNAVSLGGDCDTLTAITGSIAEAAYGIPEDIKDRVLSFLDESLLRVVQTWQEFLANKG